MTSPPPAAPLDRSAWSWAGFEWARNPYVLICVIYVLGPYIATTVVGDPVRGQQVIAEWHRTSGIIVALTAPFLGAAADRLGERKPLLGLINALLVPAIFLHWWAMPPGAGGLPLWALAIVVIAANISFAWNEVLHNSMLTIATQPRNVSRVSGLGLALGNAASVLLLLFVLIAFALPGQMALPFLPEAPLFGLDPATHAPTRIAAPIVAVWLTVFSLPLFLWTRDRSATGEALPQAFRHGVGNVVQTLRKLKDHRNIALFLVARMFYADGKIAVLIFGGVYAAGAMGWELIEMLAYGLVLSTFAVFGGVLSGWLDDHVGLKRAVAIEIGATLMCLIAMVSMSADSMFFVIPADPSAPVWGGPVFQTAPELAYLGSSMLIAISITAAFASSRALLAKLSPQGMEGELFGLYALASSATAWLAPSLVGAFTAFYQNQRAGFASIAILLVVGFVLLLWVKPPARST